MCAAPEFAPLSVLEDWPVDHASGAVVVSGSAHCVGPTERVFELASVTKLLVAYAVLVAVEEGALEFDTPAGPSGSTVRHLLAHASGLAFDEEKVRAAPGERRIYSSAGFEVLGRVLEEETGIRLPDYLTEAVLAPLGMHDSALVGPAGHGARSSVADLARFAAELASPSLISPQTHHEATTVQYPGLAGVLPGYGMQRPNDWGLGFEIRASKSPHWTGTANSPATFGHFGQSGTFLWCDPAVGVSCVVLTDRAFGDWAKPLWPAVADGVLAEVGHDGVGHDEVGHDVAD